MALHPNGVHHQAISTTDIKQQIEFFSDVLGGELKALYWMHGVPDTFHGFIELSPTCYIAFVQHPKNSTQQEIGVTHAGNAGGPMPGGTMQHIALAVDTLDELYESLTLIQTGKMRHFPVVLFGSEHWGEMLDWLRRQLATDGLISPGDVELLRVTDDPAEAVEIVIDCFARRCAL